MYSILKFIFNKIFVNRDFIKYQNPYFIGSEIKIVDKAIKSKKLIGPDNFIIQSEQLLEKQLSCRKILLTASGTDALEMACLLAKFTKGDEVIIPSFNFPSSATSVLRCGAIPVFVDIDSSDLNISIESIKKSITNKTKGIILVHYAGISAQMSKIMEIAKSNDLIVIEDAAQAIYSKYKEQYLGTIGHFGILSFHQTKNIFCGEGGALLINQKKYIHRAHIIREKGTNRHDFMNKKINKYSWVDIGSSFLPSSLQAAFLYKQLQNGFQINEKRKLIFKKYHNFFINFSKSYDIQIPSFNNNIEPNGHFYWILIPQNSRYNFIETAKLNNIELTSHFEPLHNSKAGKHYGKTFCNLDVTKSLSKKIVRIPIHTQMSSSKQEYVLEILSKTIIKHFEIESLTHKKIKLK